MSCAPLRPGCDRHGVGGGPAYSSSKAVAGQSGGHQHSLGNLAKTEAKPCPTAVSRAWSLTGTGHVGLHLFHHTRPAGASSELLPLSFSPGMPEHLSGPWHCYAHGLLYLPFGTRYLHNCLFGTCLLH